MSVVFATDIRVKGIPMVMTSDKFDHPVVEPADRAPAVAAQKTAEENTKADAKIADANAKAAEKAAKEAAKDEPKHDAKAEKQHNADATAAFEAADRKRQSELNAHAGIEAVPEPDIKP